MMAAMSIEFHRSHCKARHASSFFFPDGALHPTNPSLEKFVRTWYSLALYEMREPSLSCGASVPEQYRLLLLPTWGPPTAVRVTKVGKHPIFTAIALRGSGGYRLGEVALWRARRLSKQEGDELDATLIRADFWRTPTHDYDRYGGDGAQWILEGRKGDRYHVVDRWSPEDGPFREACVRLLNLAHATPDVVPKPTARTSTAAR
jgi:hypothetical protein